MEQVEAAVEYSGEQSTDHVAIGPRLESSMTRPPYFGVTVCSSSVALIFTTLIFILGSAMKGQETQLYLLEHRQLYEDWTNRPFVELKIEERQDTCPDGFEALFTRQWPGTSSLCIVEGQGDETEQTVTVVSDKPKFRVNQEAVCQGEELKGLEPVVMKRVGTGIICGRRAGPKLVDANEECGKDCPITTIEFVRYELIQRKRRDGYTVSEEGLTLGGTRLHVAFLKEKGEKPIMSTHLNGNIPCFGEASSTLRIRRNQSFQSLVEKEVVTSEICSQLKWRKSSRFDQQRFDTVLSTTLYDVQASNGIYESLKADVAPVYANVDFLDRKRIELKLMVRKGYPWKESCPMAKRTAFDILGQLRPYYLPVDELSNFTDPIFGHKHDGDDEGYHDETPHHSLGLHPEITNGRIQSTQGFCLLYLIVIVLFVSCFIGRKPRIQNQKGRLSWQKLKIFLIWTPFVLLVIVAELFVVSQVVLSQRFATGWFDLLDKLKDSYPCTLPSVYIDVDFLRLQYEQSGFNELATFIVALASVNCFLIVVQFCSFYIMMIRWYRENPIVSGGTIRSIQVGIAVDESNQNAEQEARGEPVLGKPVPEADRQEHPQPLVLVKVKSVPGMPLEEEDKAESSEVESVHRQSQPQTPRVIYQQSSAAPTPIRGSTSLKKQFSQGLFDDMVGTPNRFNLPSIDQPDARMMYNTGQGFHSCDKNDTEANRTALMLEDQANISFDVRVQDLCPIEEVKSSSKKLSKLRLNQIYDESAILPAQVVVLSPETSLKEQNGPPLSPGEKFLIIEENPCKAEDL